MLPEPPALQPASHPHKVLIVEDNEDAALSLKVLLELWGHEVKVAFNGLDGLAMARDWEPDVVLCDIGLPGLTGFGVARGAAVHGDTPHRHHRLRQ
jgi:CheY-like chemotaxis protein